MKGEDAFINNVSSPVGSSHAYEMVFFFQASEYPYTIAQLLRQTLNYLLFQLVFFLGNKW